MGIVFGWVEWEGGDDSEDGEIWWSDGFFELVCG